MEPVFKTEKWQIYQPDYHLKKQTLIYWRIQGLKVESERIELSSKQVTKELSTRLFCSCFFDCKLVTDNLLTT